MPTLTLTSANATWSPVQKITFRFIFLYFFLYIFPFPLNAFDPTEGLFDWVEQGWNYLAQGIAPWFSIEEPVSSQITGSGDKIHDFLTNFLQLTFAILFTVLWSFLDRKRPSYSNLWVIFLIMLRFFLAWNMMIYGFSKVFKLQFPDPGLYRMLQPYGESSPMGLAWTFMGASDIYTWFAGAMEVLAGALLLFRRTATLGGLTAFGVMLNVFMMNMGYDIPVKLFSFNLMLMGLVIAAPDLGRLLNLLLTNRPIQARDRRLYLPNKWWKIGRWVVKLAFIGYAIIWYSYQTSLMLEEYGEDRVRPALYGIYEVDHFIHGGDTIPPLQTDTLRWKKIVVNYPGYIRVIGMDDQRMNYMLETDTLTQSVALRRFSDSTAVFKGSYLRTDSSHFAWQGMMEGKPLQLDLKWYDDSYFLLKNRGFHWVNPIPYNR